MSESPLVQISMDLKCLADLAFFNQQNVPLFLNHQQQIDEDGFDESNEEEVEDKSVEVDSNRLPFEYVMHNGTRTLVIGKILLYFYFKIWLFNCLILTF